jgi:hypothetical protein
MSPPSSRRVALPPREGLRMAGAARLVLPDDAYEDPAGPLGMPAGCHGREFNNFHFTISNRLRTQSAHCYRTAVTARNVR